MAVAHSAAPTAVQMKKCRRSIRPIPATKVM